MAPPQWDASVSPASTLGATGNAPYWVSLSERMMRQTSTQGGKQYEMDAAQTGTWNTTLDNRDAAFNPVNTSGPYSPAVSAFRPLRLRAQYPSTVQLLTANQATMGDAGSVVATTLATAPAVNMVSQTDAGADIVVIGDAWQGTRVMQANIGNGVGPGNLVLGAFGVAVHPGRVHAFQCRIRCPSGTSPQLAAILSWRDFNGNVISSVQGTTTTITSGSSTWVQLTVVGTPPANAVGVVPGVVVAVATTGSCVTQHDGWQTELAAAPSTWVQPGTWYPVFYGGAERWPQIYDMGGTFGQTQPVVVDAFALLAGIYPQPPFVADALALGPAFLFALNDPTGSTQCVDATGNLLPAPVANTQYGAGSLTFGNSMQATTPAGQFLGYPGPVATFNNTALGVNAAATYIDISRAGNLGPPVSGPWTRFLAFRALVNQTNEVTMWAASGPTYSSPSPFVAFHILGSTDGGGHPGYLDLTIDQSNGSVASHVPVSAGSVCDGNWHYVFLTCDGAGNYKVYSDTITSNPFTITLTNPSGPGFNGITTDLVGVLVETGTQRAYNGFVGDLGAVIQWDAALNSTQINSLTTSWRTAWSGDASGTRYVRILGYAGYPGLYNVGLGATLDMGPATDIDGKTDALTLLTNVVTTENGVHYIAADGTITEEARTSRYNKLTPTYTFGENTAGGEWPYEDVAFDFDITRVVGQVQITQNSTGQIFVANSPTTLSPNYRPTYQRTINVVNPQECVDAANYLANRYANPQLRVQKIRLHPAAVTGFWPVALSLSISTRVRVMRRAPGAPPIQFDGFIENIKWAIDWDTGDAFLDLEISPANLQLYWVLSALHTTIHTGVSAGANSVVLNALPDSASNPAAASFCAGLQMTLEPGTANSETLTVLSVSATSPGYTTFTVTFTANMAFNHAINTTVSEALPAGTTDPTTWDPASILGTSTTLAY